MLRRRWEEAWSRLGPLVALIAVVAFFAVAEGVQRRESSFFTWENLQLVAGQTATVAMAALGMTVIIIAGGIDLSAGTALALCATVLAWCLREDVAVLALNGTNVRSAEARVTAAESEFERLTADASPEQRAQHAAALSEAKRRLEAIRAASARWTPPLAVVLCILTGAAAGLLNGAIITRLKVIPFIVTLGTMSVFLGLAKLIANETTVRPLPGQRPDWLANLLSVRAPVLGLPPGVWITLVLAVVLAIVLQRTVFGRHVYALGSNEATARLCGIDVARTKLIVYAIGGLFVGLAGILFFSRVGNGNPTSGNDYALRIIAAVVIGGGSLNGGRGTVLGTITGAAIVEVIRSGGTQLGLSNPVQDVILGVIIVAAVVIDQWRQRANE